MEIFDIIVLVFIGYGLVRGFSKGFVIEVSGFIALFAGIYGALHFSDFISIELAKHVDWSPKSIQITSFALLFIVCVYAVSLLAKMLTKVIHLAALGILNRMLGATFGLLKMTLILSALLMAYLKASTVVSLFPDTFLEQSLLYDPLLGVGQFLFEWVLDNSDQLPKNLNII